MVDCFQQGFDVVYGVRRERKNDTFFKRTTALTFYRLMSLLGARTVYNHADFRLMSRRAIEALKEYGEVSLFPLRRNCAFGGISKYQRVFRSCGTLRGRNQVSSEKND